MLNKICKIVLQIPASIEEVIAAVSTAKPTVDIKQYKKNVSYDNMDENIETQISKKQNSKLIIENISKNEQRKKLKSKAKRNVKFKIKTKLKFPMTQVKQKTIKIMNQENKKTEISRVEITTGKGLAVPICEGEEIVSILFFNKNKNSKSCR